MDESSTGVVKRGMSMANRKFVVQVGPHLASSGLSFEVRSSAPPGSYRGVVRFAEHGGIAASCQCEASRGQPVCKHAVAALLVNWQESPRDCFVVQAMSPNRQEDGAASDVPQVSSGHTWDQAAWRRRVEDAGWGRILDLSVREAAGNGLNQFFGSDAQARHLLMGCHEPLLNFALTPESTTLPPLWSRTIHAWLLEAVTAPNARRPWRESSDADHLADRGVDALLYSLRERVAGRPQTMANALYEEIRMLPSERDPELTVANLPVPYFEPTTCRPSVIVRMGAGRVDGFDVVGLDTTTSPELVVSLASSAVLHRLADSTEFTETCRELLHRDVFAKYISAWRGWMPDHDRAGAEQPALTEPSAVVGYRICRPDSPVYRYADVVVARSSPARRKAEGKGTWVLAAPSLLKSLLDTPDSALASEHRQILDRFRSRNANELATKKFTIPGLTAEHLGWLVNCDDVVDEVGRPIAVRRVKPTLHLKKVGADRARVSLTVGTLDISDMELPDPAGFGRSTADDIVGWDQAGRTFWLTPKSSVVLRFRREADRLLGEVGLTVLNEILPVLPALLEFVEVDVDPELTRRATNTRLAPFVRARRRLDGVRFEVVCKASGYRVPLRPGQGPAIIHTSTAESPVVIERDLPWEVATARELVGRLGLDRLPEEPRWTFDSFDYGEVARVLEAVAEEGSLLEWVESEPITLSTASVSSVSLRLSSKRDWFELQGGLQLGRSVVDLASLLEAIREDRRTIVVGADELVVIDEEVRRAFGLLAFQGRRGLPKLRSVHAELINELQSEGVAVEVPEAFRVRADALKASLSEDMMVPPALRAELRPYQEVGYRWLCRMAKWAPGACLADDMGLGKTLQALAFLLARASDGAALVVTPTSLTRNWSAEAARFAPSLSVHRWASKEGVEPTALGGPGSVVVVSYDVLVNNVERFAPQRWSTVVLDEAHAIKNAATQRAGAVRQLSADFRLALTGTPLENRTSELWGLFDFVAPGLLGSLSDFTAAWARPIEQHRDPRASEALSRLVRPFLLRRLKRDVARELPAKVERNIHVELSEGERAVYQQLRDASVNALTTRRGRAENPGKNRILLLAALTRMRQAACHARMVSEEAPLVSSKQAVLMDLVEELVAEERRVLVFSQFPSVFAYLRDGLNEQGVRFGQLDGSTPSEQRARLVEAFEAGEFAVFLLSVKAGGTGLNLLSADTVIHFDPWWNPAVEDQATDRAHRIGQTQTVQVIRLVSTGTVEEGILAMHADKRALTEAMLDGTDSAAALTIEELSGLVLSGA